jgi:hypothetical protein
MPSIPLSRPLRSAAAAQEREASAGVQDRSTTASDPISPTLFWKIIMVLAIASLACNAIGMAVFGRDWLTAYWDALTYWCVGGYC